MDDAKKPSQKRPSDEEIHAMAFKRMAAQPEGNTNARRKDTLVLNVEKKPNEPQP